MEYQIQVSTSVFGAGTATLKITEASNTDDIALAVAAAMVSQAQIAFPGDRLTWYVTKPGDVATVGSGSVEAG